MTLLQLAQRCGTTPQTIQRLETANMTMSLEWLEKLCSALDVHPMQFFADEDVPAFQLERRVQDICLEAGVLTMRSQDFAAKLQQFLDEVGGSDAR